jgi:GH15 family glucan-1,4-alpha-glucosidase
MAQPIEDHGIVGDLRTTALVALDGTIDFLCWPRFDSPSVFASLLGTDANGLFSLRPVLNGARHRQLYVPDTNVLLTRFLSHEGVAEVSDFMPVAEVADCQRLVRRVKAVRHACRFRMVCAPRFDYGRQAHSATFEGDAVLFRPDGGGPALRLSSTLPLTIENGTAICDFELEENHTAAFVLEDGDQSPTSPDDSMVSRDFKLTCDFWRDWVARSHYRGRWRDSVTRSSLALKALTSAEHGSMIAAATFGLPEQIGGARNWDYRYTWLRDAAFTVYAFLRLGHVQEANAFIGWLGDRARDIPQGGALGIMYAVDGGATPDERELPHLSGYLDSRPVRIGNGAAGQLQLDIYGELMDALYLCDAHGEQVSHERWAGVVQSMNWLADNWQQPDEGIWEVRGGRRNFLHSRLMCWVAFDRAIRLSRKRGLPAPKALWAGCRDAIYTEIHEEFWNQELGYFVQYKGGTTLDASCLLMPLVRFISATDPRFRSTLDAVGRILAIDSLVYRYDTGGDDDGGPGHDGLHGDEGSFTMCSFWYVECLARAGDLAQARFLFDKMLGYANHVGLFAEELGPAGEHLGNFPQAFTHLALISAAHYLDRALSR